MRNVIEFKTSYKYNTWVTKFNTDGLNYYERIIFKGI